MIVATKYLVPFNFMQFAMTGSNALQCYAICEWQRSRAPELFQI